MIIAMAAININAPVTAIMTNGRRLNEVTERNARLSFFMNVYVYLA